MAAKEPTVEHMEMAERALRLAHPARNIAGVIAQAIADAEQASAERAWDEGYANGLSDAQTSTMYPRATNPYRLPKGPTK